MKKTLYVASKNHGKINEYQRMLFNVNCQLLSQPESIEVIEDGLSFEENAMKKACEVAKRTNSFSIADDSGLEVDLLEGEPGIYSSRWGGKKNNFNIAIKKVLKKMNKFKDNWDNINSARFLAK